MNLLGSGRWREREGEGERGREGERESSRDWLAYPYAYPSMRPWVRGDAWVGADAWVGGGMSGGGHGDMARLSISRERFSFVYLL